MQVRFYVHQFGMNPGSINLSSVEIKEKENVTTTLWWSSKNLGEYWVRVDIILPNITTKYVHPNLGGFFVILMKLFA